MAMEGKAVWAAAGKDVVKYMRGKEVRYPSLRDHFRRGSHRQGRAALQSVRCISCFNSHIRHTTIGPI